MKINGPKLACDAKSSTVSPTSGCLSSNGISQQGHFGLAVVEIGSHRRLAVVEIGSQLVGAAGTLPPKRCWMPIIATHLCADHMAVLGHPHFSWLRRGCIQGTRQHRELVFPDTTARLLSLLPRLATVSSRLSSCRRIVRQRVPYAPSARATMSQHGGSKPHRPKLWSIQRVKSIGSSPASVLGNDASILPSSSSAGDRDCGFFAAGRIGWFRRGRNCASEQLLWQIKQT